MEFQGPFDRNAKRVLETSARRAGLLGKNTVGTEHLLLGLAARRSSAAGRILTQAGVSSWRGLYYTAKLTGTGMPRQKPQHISRNLQLVLRQAAGAAGNGTAGENHLLCALISCRNVRHGGLWKKWKRISRHWNGRPVFLWHRSRQAGVPWHGWHPPLRWIGIPRI